MNIKKNYLLALLIINLMAFVYYLYFFKGNGYLPKPFFYDTTNSFMDLFNPMFWSCNEGAYKVWGAIYPPLSFLILKIIHYVFLFDINSSPEIMRSSGAVVIYTFILFYLFSPFVVFQTRIWEQVSKIDKILIYIILVSSAPMLFTLERGNIILFVPIILALTFSENFFVRLISISILVNIKPYFAILFLFYILHKDWKGFFRVSFLTALIFFTTGLFFGNDFWLFFLNIFHFSQGAGTFPARELMAFPSSISAFSYFIEGERVFRFASGHIPYYLIHLFPVVIEIVKWIVLLMVILLLYKNYDRISHSEVLSALVILISNLGVWVGGYTLILYYVLIPVFWRMKFKTTYFLLLAVLAMPLDLVGLVGEDIGMQESYLSNSMVNVHWTLGLGSLVRPVINLTLLIVLSFEFSLRRKTPPSNNPSIKKEPALGKIV